MEKATILAFEKVINNGIPVFIIVSILFWLAVIRKEIKSMVLDCVNAHGNNQKETMAHMIEGAETPSELLAALTNCQLASEKADAFIGLMVIRYVLIHKIVNKGNKYDDKRQSVRFSCFLTPVAIEKLNNMDGKPV